MEDFRVVYETTDFQAASVQAQHVAQICNCEVRLEKDLFEGRVIWQVVAPARFHKDMYRPPDIEDEPIPLDRYPPEHRSFGDRCASDPRWKEDENLKDDPSVG